ncbi:UDP-Glycosyltransferase/glycogen phosphorylase [Rickenella mellea]|uniref:UDP-Glycosyltransferase/glycogen phosphorylase n=1 Tax=Rickenella mellea TaxID=50990 RepID=A0A4Y7QHS2_9AGAM|nr:UDP-Glycosyltransferase/glycogen phosphorylase [Rickenella mellea]
MSAAQGFHIVAVPPNEWGHMRPMIAFLSRLLALDSHLTVTLIVAESTVERSHLELSTQLASESVTASDVRMKIVSVPVTMFWPAEQYLPQLKKVYAQVVDEKQPDLALVESMLHPFFDFARSIAKKSFKIACWLPVALPSWSSIAPICYIRDDPEGYVKEVEDIMKAEGTSYMESSNKAYFQRINGRRISIPGFPEMSDYEGFPQEPPVIIPVAMVVDWVFGFRDADVLVTTTAHALEKQGLEAFSHWLKDHPKGARILSVGPLTSKRIPEVAEKERLQADESGLTLFLDKWVERKGNKSVLYICFGSVLQPADPEMLYAVFRVLLELNIPFVVVMNSSAEASVPPDLAHTMKESGLTFISPWAPQQYVLSHPAVGWFLSHCGINGTLESLSLGVPMICWPLFADQPVLSILVTQVYGCGYELTEVRRGFGLKYRASTGKTPTGKIEDIIGEAKEVFTRAFFDEKEREKVTANVDQMANSLNAAWDRGGDARNNALELLEFMRRK